MATKENTVWSNLGKPNKLIVSDVLPKSKDP